MRETSLTDDEFKKIHNAFCAFAGVKQRLEGVVHPDIIKQLSDACDELLAGIQRPLDVMDAEDDENAARARAYGKAIKVKSVWSMDVPASFDDIAFRGVSRLHYRNQTISLPTDVSWKILWIASDLLIFEGEPTDHIFIEGFDLSLDGTYLTLRTGS
jgi:hypothetical protein